MSLSSSWFSLAAIAHYLLLEIFKFRFRLVINNLVSVSFEFATCKYWTFGNISIYVHSLVHFDFRSSLSLSISDIVISLSWALNVKSWNRNLILRGVPYVITKQFYMDFSISRQVDCRYKTFLYYDNHLEVGRDEIRYWILRMRRNDSKSNVLPNAEGEWENLRANYGVSVRHADAVYFIDSTLYRRDAHAAKQRPINSKIDNDAIIIIIIHV